VLLIGDQLTLFRFQDTLRPDIAAVLSQLRADHQLRLMILTGDHHNNARAIAEKVGIDEYHADLRPEDKLNHVSQLSQQYGLAMIGDGINDAPALARATTGISMGQVGSRTAIDASDVVLLQDRLDLLSWLWKKAYSTRSVVRQNITLAFAAIIFASLAAISGLIPLWLAVVLHEGGTVVVGLNSLRLLR
jgi:P-type E1-E2 ATPase